MNSDSLRDLEVLILQCRSEQARRHIDEAVRAYRAGAFRASIVMTWVAIVFDFVDKLRELALTGDKNAESKVQQFEKLQASGDVNGALRFENGLLTIAETEFEFISPIEREELERLHTDRHRCAHPSVIRDDEKYHPSAELARLHLRNAVEYVLRLPPVQGKAALARLFSEVGSEYFPTSEEEAFRALRNGPLARPRPSLVRNFFLATLKTVLCQQLSEKQLSQRYAALAATLDLHREVCEQVTSDSISNLVASMRDNELGRAVRFLAIVPELVDTVPDNVEIRLKAYADAMPSQDLPSTLAPALGLTITHDSTVARTGRLTASEVQAIGVASSTGQVPDAALDRLVGLYEQAGSYDEANSVALALTPFAPSLSREQVHRVFGATSNSQVLDSFSLGQVLRAIRQASLVPPDEFDQLMTSKGLDDGFRQLMFHPPAIPIQNEPTEELDETPF